MMKQHMSNTFKEARQKWWNFPWNFHRVKTVELSAEIPQKVLHVQVQGLNRGTFSGISTDSSPISSGHLSTVDKIDATRR